MRSTDFINEEERTYVAGRDFVIVDEANGYVLGADDHLDRDNTKITYDIFKYVKTTSYEYKGITFQQKQYRLVKPLDVSPYVKQPELKLAFRKAVGELNEDKKKGANGKACWDGYRYAGTKNGKDKCVPTGKGKTKKESKTVKEDIASDAMRMEKDHEVQMARAQMYRIARDAMNLHDLLRQIPPETDLPSWLQNKITIAEEYVTTAMNYMQSEERIVPEVPAMTGMTEMTTAGSVATVSQPLGKTQRRTKRKGTLLGEKDVPKTSRYRVGDYTIVHTNEPNKQGQYQGKVFSKEGEVASDSSEDLKDLKEKLKQAALNAHRDALRGAESKGAYITGQDRAAIDFNAAFTREVLGGFEPTAARLVRENGNIYLDVMDQEYFDAFGADKSEGFVRIQNRQATKNETATQLFGMGLSPGRAARLGLENHGVYMLDQTTEGDEMFTRYELDLIGYSDRRTSYPVPTLTIASWIGGMKNGS